jgi:FHA domain
MPTLVLDLLKYAFLAVLYIFIARAVKAVYVELRPPEARRRRGKGSGAPVAARPPARRSKKSGRRIAVVEGAQKGKSFDIGDELTIGRGEQCHLVLDDTYASQVHARIFSRDDTVMVEDLGSTNGTYLNRQRLSAPAELQRGDQIKIGKTVLEMRK